MMARNRHVESQPSVRLPTALNRCGAALLDQQMWCWGCDVRRAEGNLLLHYGAQKRPSPDPRYHSAYSVCLNTGAVLNLWGWGLWIAHEECGSLLLSRSRFRVRYTSAVVLMPDAWQERELPYPGSILDDTCRAAAYRLLADMLRWIGEYESWLLTQVAPEYRERVVTAWPQRRHHRGGFPPSHVPQQWLKWSQILREECPN